MYFQIEAGAEAEPDTAGRRGELLGPDPEEDCVDGDEDEREDSLVVPEFVPFSPSSVRVDEFSGQMGSLAKWNSELHL